MPPTPKPSKAAAKKSRGLFRRWFEGETPLLTLANVSLCIGILLLALPMTSLGAQFAAALGVGAATFLATTLIASYVGLALLLLGALKAAHTYFFRKSGRITKIVDFAAACILLAVGAWIALAEYFSSSVPSLLAPQFFLAVGALARNIDFFNNNVMPFAGPALATVFGLLLSAKLIRTSSRIHAGSMQKFLLMVGLIASTFTFAIGTYAGVREIAARDPARAQLNLRTDLLLDDPSAYAPPFARGAQCHISDRFGTRADPFDLHHNEFHPGIDIAVAYGTPVHAIAAGTVAFAGDAGGFGNMIAIRADDGTRNPPAILAGHMSRLFVKVGDVVRKGDVIGAVGSTGRSTGPHLHLQLCPDGHASRGGFSCGAPKNPYETWRMLIAIARASCALGPTV